MAMTTLSVCLHWCSIFSQHVKRHTSPYCSVGVEVADVVPGMTVDCWQIVSGQIPLDDTDFPTCMQYCQETT